MSIPFVRRFVLAVASLLALSTAVLAADPPAAGGKDLLDEAKKRDQVAQQKAEGDFRAALIEMSKLEASNPARAAERLQKMLGVLEEDTVLAPAKREAWKRVLKDRIRVSQAEADRAGKGVAEDGVRDAKKEDRKAIEEQKGRDEAQRQREFKEIRRLQQAGKSDEAQRRANDLASRYPDSPSAVASSRITGTANALREYRLIKDQKANGWTLAMNDVDRSSILPKDPDFNFPSPEKWRQITKARTKSIATEKEKAILKALDTTFTVSFEGSTIESVIDYLQTLSGQTIILDKSTLEAAGINYDTPINLRKLRRVTLRTILRKVLGEVGLSYIVEQETIHVVTPKEAQEKMTVRTYYLGDLAWVDTGILGPAFGAATAAKQVGELIQMIVSTVDPDSWQINNPEAKGTIMYLPGKYAIIVKQSAEIHYMLGGLGGR